MKKIKLTSGIIVVLLMASIIMTSCGTETTETVPSEPVETAGKVTEAAGAEEETASEEATSETATEETKSTGTVSADIVYPDKAYADDTDKKLEASSTGYYTKTRTNDKKSGDIVDTAIFKDKGNIVKIIREDYGSEGRMVSEYYYNGDKTVYMRQHKTDIYGINSSVKEADLTDAEADYTKEVMAESDEALKEAAKDTGKTLLYGYAGDEQGGVLKNVTVKLRNVDGDYTDETTTDGDGYYTFSVPQKDDTYNLTYIYGDCIPSSLNDVHIIPGTPEYSLGRCFVAPEGQGIHETDVYLLNANKKSPVSLKDGEYAAVLTSDDGKMTMRMVNTDDQKYETGIQIKFDPSKSKKGYALFVEDEAYLSKDDMAGNIGRTYMTVTIYDKDGIVAAYREPSGRLGTLWKVCDIDEKGDIAISGIMFTDTKGWAWLE